MLVSLSSIRKTESLRESAIKQNIFFFFPLHRKLKKIIITSRLLHVYTFNKLFLVWNAYNKKFKSTFQIKSKTEYNDLKYIMVHIFY